MSTLVLQDFVHGVSYDACIAALVKFNTQPTGLSLLTSRTLR